MTQSPFDDKPDIRKYSVMPARAIQDDGLHWTSLRVLGALCLHTNAYGICWPSRVTIARHISRSTKTVSVHVKRLIDKGYVRKLQPKAYPFKGKSNWRTNRYQVMFDGAQTELPSREQFYAPRPKVAIDDPTEEAVAVINKERGSGGENVAFSSLSQAFCLGVERVSGSHRVTAPQDETAKVLAMRGVTAEQVIEATSSMTKARLKRGQTPPMTLEQVAQWAGL